MKRGILGTLLAAAILSTGPGAALAQDKSPQKVLRYAFQIAETGFDPAQVSDVYSRIITANIFDALYEYDYLARPAKIKPAVAVGMPEISKDFRTFTVKIKPGIYFADDPAFGGKKRELVAQDFVYSFKRHFDPKSKSPLYSDLEEQKLVGMDVLRKAAEKPGAKFDFDREVEGIRALDRYTIQFNLEEGRPRFLSNLADGGVVGAVAREVAEKYGDKIMEHPVGTGPFMLKADEWTRSSKIVLVRNPNFREEFYVAEPPANDQKSQEIYKRMKGKRIPLIDRVEVSIIEEPQPRWISFLQQDYDFLDRLPNAFAVQAIPNNKLAPNLVKRGIVMERVPAADMTFTYFNMEDPVVGGYTPDKVALRRAISLVYNTEDEIRLPRRNQAIIAQGLIPPHTYGYDTTFKSEMNALSPARGLALLDMYGYVDKDGDGWRDLPDGKPLVLKYSTTPAATDRELIEIWKKSMDAAHIKIEFLNGKWPEHLKAARSGKLMMWGLSLSASGADSEGFLARGYGPEKGMGNLARFDLKVLNDLYVQQQSLPDGPERLAILKQINKILLAYMPYKVSTHRIHTDMSQPWLIGYRRHPFTHAIWWRYIDIDNSLRK
jgi:ABC-type transport system substrate-binding protein